jgi:predicted RNA-binding Zn-ribbon protein involved in translation (DUF1610 family)
MGENSNCLAGFQCPNCGQTDRFKIIALCEVTVVDEGTEESSGFEWDSDSVCTCPDCGRVATVGVFQKDDADSAPEAEFFFCQTGDFEQEFIPLQATNRADAQQEAQNREIGLGFVCSAAEMAEMLPTG